MGRNSFNINIGKGSVDPEFISPITSIVVGDRKIINMPPANAYSAGHMPAEYVGYVDDSKIKAVVLNDRVLGLLGSGLFYGSAPASNKVTLLSATAALVQAESNIGTARTYTAGADIGANALFYGGHNGSTYVNTTTLLSPTGTLVQPEGNVGTARRGMGGTNVGANALFYGGTNFTTAFKITTLLSPTATLRQTEGSVGGTERVDHTGAKVGVNALFYGGVPALNLLSILSHIGALLQAESNIGTARRFLAGVRISDAAMFYGGFNTSGVVFNKTTILSSTGTLVQAESDVGIAREGLAGANVGPNALFYGGHTAGSYINKATLLSPTAVLVQPETSVGSTRAFTAGASV